MSRTLLLLASVITLVVWHLNSANAQAASTVQEQLNGINSKLANNEIGKVEIENLPSSILTRTRLTPEMLDKQFEYKTTIRDLRGNAYNAQLSEAVKSSVVSPSEDITDIRWGIIFFDLNDHRVGALYFNASGRQGMFDDKPVAISGTLFKWLNSTFSETFR